MLVTFFMLSFAIFVVFAFGRRARGRRPGSSLTLARGVTDLPKYSTLVSWSGWKEGMQVAINGVLFLCVPHWGLARDLLNLRIKLTPFGGHVCGSFCECGASEFAYHLLWVCKSCGICGTGAQGRPRHFQYQDVLTLCVSLCPVSCGHKDMGT